MSGFITSFVALPNEPVGELTFYISRIPDRDTASLTWHTVADAAKLTYNVAFDGFGLWYYWHKDDSGYSDSYAVWVDGESFEILDAIGERLRQLLEANRQGIDVAIGRIAPGIEIKQILYSGTAANIDDWPAVRIGAGRYRSEYFAAPYGTDTLYTYPIDCLVAHEDEQTQTRLAARLAEIVANILSQPAYETFTLTNGVQVSFGFVSDVEIEENFVGERLGSRGSLFWSGRVTAFLM